MNSYQIQFIEKENILSIVPFLMELNGNISEEILSKRTLEMIEQNYRCLGVYDKGELIGICGMWFMTRHYSGRSIEVDHVMINKSYREKGLGKQLFDWIHDYANKNNVEACELNTYVRNTRSHKFYYNLGYEIRGFHFVKELD
ncbi:MAG: GNAT family N-acetyltransferase [Flavobacteriales bacterium]|jgi:GNAT superfamily N-acetyltransferase|nr:GNAT family N-acetyltransferase [Flavobacteriales bacterium]